MNLKARLSKLNAFRHFDEEALSLLASSLEHRHFREGDVLIEEGGRSSDLFVLLEGEVEVVQKGHAAVRRLGSNEEGQLIGLMTLILDTPRTATVRAVTDVHTAAITRYAFDLLYLHDGPASMPFCELVCAQLVADARTVNDAFFDHESLHGTGVSKVELSESHSRLNETLRGVQSLN